MIIASLDPISNKPSQKTINKRKLDPPAGEVSFQKVQYVLIDSDHAGRRIDNFLSNFFKTIPKGRIYKMLRKGEVRVNKKRIKPNYKLVLEDSLRIPPVYLEEKPELQIPYRIIDQLEKNSK